MNKASMERWVWILIYGGLLLASLGAFITREPQDGDLGLSLLCIGGLATLGGVLLIWLRSRQD